MKVYGKIDEFKKMDIKVILNDNEVLYEGKIVYRIIISFLFVIFISLLYFWGLMKINNGIVHIYFLLSYLALFHLILILLLYS